MSEENTPRPQPEREESGEERVLRLLSDEPARDPRTGTAPQPKEERP